MLSTILNWKMGAVGLKTDQIPEDTGINSTLIINIIISFYDIIRSITALCFSKKQTQPEARIEN